MTDTIFFEISFPRKNPKNYVLEPDVMFWVGAKGGFHLVHLLVFSFVYHTVYICRQGVGIEQAVSTMIVGKTFVTGVQRFCQLILMLNTYFRLKACNLYRSKTYFRLKACSLCRSKHLKQVCDLHKLQAFNLKQVFNIKISWQNL